MANESYLKVLTPVTYNGTNPVMNADGTIKQRESHLHVSALKRMEKKNNALPQHLKHVLEIVTKKAGPSIEEIQLIQKAEELKAKESLLEETKSELEETAAELEIKDSEIEALRKKIAEMEAREKQAKEAAKIPASDPVKATTAAPAAAAAPKAQAANTTTAK